MGNIFTEVGHHSAYEEKKQGFCVKNTNKTILTCERNLWFCCKLLVNGIRADGYSRHPVQEPKSYLKVQECEAIKCMKSDGRHWHFKIDKKSKSNYSGLMHMRLNVNAKLIKLWTKSNVY